MDPHEEMPAVVYCVLTNKSDLQTLDLSAAESPAGVNPEIKAKEVIVHSSSGGYINFEHVEGARWMARFRPREGAEYSLRVVLENGEELTAETVFPDSVMVNDYYADREHPDHRFYNPYHEPHHDYMDELYFADRLFDQRAHYLSPEILGYNYYNQTRSFGFKLLDTSRGPFEPHYNEMRWGTNRLVEEVGEKPEGERGRRTKGGRDFTDGWSQPIGIPILIVSLGGVRQGVLVDVSPLRKDKAQEVRMKRQIRIREQSVETIPNTHVDWVVPFPEPILIESGNQFLIPLHKGPLDPFTIVD